jgi:protein phosphatase
MKDLSFPSNALIVLCGPSGSGKSYFAHKFFRPSQIVSSDDCRKMIADDPANQRVSPEAFELFYKIIECRLKYNRLTVADATHLVVRYRTPLIQLAREYHRPIYLIIFDTDAEHCLKHNALRRRNVHPDVIARHFEKFTQACQAIQSEPFVAVHTLRPEDIETLRIVLCPGIYI